MECCNKCLLKDDCAVIGCVLSYPVLQKGLDEIILQLRAIREDRRMKFLRKIMEQRQPPKVSTNQMNRWWSMRVLGFDMDRNWNKMTRKQKRFQKNLDKIFSGTPKKEAARINNEKPDKSGKPIIIVKSTDVFKEALSEPEPNFHY